MNSRELIDAQFDRAVEIVQNLPKTGPVQTGYEEKLSMYSLYKQATAGNVTSPRPGIWDMLGRAKWDAWAKHKDLDPYEAKWLYVDALLKVLRRYPDKTVARDHVRELESFGGDPANLVHSGTFSRSPDSDSSSSEEQAGSIYRSAQIPPQLRGDLKAHHEGSSSEEETTDDEAMGSSPQQTAAINRPQSSLSTHRYRTPGTSSTLLSTPGVPASQPQGVEILSAFGGPSTATLSSYPQTYAEQAASRDVASPHNQPIHRRPPSARPHALSAAGLPHRPPSRLALERAIESIQTQLAALSERIEIMESHSFITQPSGASPGPSRSSPTFVGGGSRSPNGVRDVIHWDFDEMGLWAIVFKALGRMLKSLREFAIFLSNNEGRSPTFVVLRRLFLDLSFILCALTLIKTVWRRTGVRRRAVNAAMRALWWAIVGKTPARSMADRGI